MSTQELPFYKLFVGGAFSACFAETATIPIDTAKVRLQVQGQTKILRYKGLVDCVTTIAKEEGVLALWNGVTAGLMRQCVFGGIRLALYEPVRDMMAPPENGPAGFAVKLAAGVTVGAIAMTCAQPTDLVKIRIQSQGSQPGAVKKGAVQTLLQIAREEGVARLWTGLGPNVARNATINAVELATYDQFKQLILRHELLPDNWTCYAAASMGCGFAATVVGSPVDVVKTRVMSGAKGPDGKKMYTSALDCVGKTFRNEGPRAFYNGFWPNYFRIGTWNVIMFLCFEQVKGLMREQQGVPGSAK